MLKKCNDHYIGHSLNPPGIWGVLFQISDGHLYVTDKDKYVKFDYCPNCGRDIKEIWQVIEKK